MSVEIRLEPLDAFQPEVTHKVYIDGVLWGVLNDPAVGSCGTRHIQVDLNHPAQPDGYELGIRAAHGTTTLEAAAPILQAFWAGFREGAQYVVNSAQEALSEVMP